MTQRNPSLNDLKAEIMQRLNIQGYYEQATGNRLVQEKSDGWAKRIKCVIHGDQRTPNLFINLLTGQFKCHSCGKGGSVFDFWCYLNKRNPETDYKIALASLAEFCGLNTKEWQQDWMKNPPKAAVELPPVSSGKLEPRSVIPERSLTDEHDTDNDPIDEAIVEKFRGALTKEQVAYLNKVRGLKKATMLKAEIGWHAAEPYMNVQTNHWEHGRIALPVRDKEGKLRNLRLYTNKTAPDFKMVNYVANRKEETEKGYGKPVRLYPLHWFIREGWDHVVLVEGEWDALLLNQYLQEMGLTNWGALSGTHGANTFLPEWLRYFRGKHIYLCLDCDDAGKTAMQQHATKYLLPMIKEGLVESARIVNLPLEGSKESKDIGDYFLKCKFTGENFVELCCKSDLLVIGGVDEDEAATKPMMVTNLVEAIKNRDYIDKRIQVPLSISGSTTGTFHAIRDFRIYDCLHDKEKDTCCQEGEEILSIPYGHPLYIESCNEKEVSILHRIACSWCSRDGKCKVAPIKKVVMQQFFATQVVNRWKSEASEDGSTMRNAQELLQVPMFLLQPPDNMQVEPKSYLATGFVRTHPKTNAASLFVEKMTQVDDDYKKFTVETPENRRLLKILKEEYNVDKILDEITKGVTQIYDSDDVLYAVLLSYLTPLHFNFNGRKIRGWMNVAILGDSGTGKSATYQRISDWINLGDLFSILSGTRTGLLYAVTQKAREWQVSVGRYVTASGTIMAIDEADKAVKEDLQKMAIAMHTGWLEVNQVASGGYWTQTRAIFILNPKKRGEATTLSDFPYGCDALRECFDPMFIRRLDLAIFAMGRSSHELYNQRATDAVNISLTAKMFRTLVYWAWTRTPSQIEWTEDATMRCLGQAERMSRLFGDTDQVPLVNPQDFREKLARISTAYAILCCSFTPDYNGLVVLPHHVDHSARLIEMIYSANSCNLLQRSRYAARQNREATDDEYSRMKKAIEDTINSRLASTGHYRNNLFAQLLSMIQQTGTFRHRDLIDRLMVSQRWLARKLGLLQQFNLIEATREGMQSTRKFNLFMHRWTEEDGVREMLEQAYVMDAQDDREEAMQPRHTSGPARQASRQETAPEEDGTPETPGAASFDFDPFGAGL